MFLFCFVFVFKFACAQNVPAKAITQTMLLKGAVNADVSGIYSSRTGYKKNNSSSTASDLPSDFPRPDEHYKEVIGKRTLASRTFVNDKGGVIIKNGSKNLNYPDRENKLQPISAKLSSGKAVDSPAKTSWTASHQEFPAFLNYDGSTGFTADEKNKIVFNKNCTINDAAINCSDFTVGEDGMLVNNAAAGIDKKIMFSENTVETDYIIHKPLDLNNKDLVISEEIELPEGYKILEEATSPQPSPQERENKYAGQNFSPLSCGEGIKGRGSDYVVYSSDNKEKARFNAPVFYDDSKAFTFGRYKLIKENGKIILQLIIPERWLNDAERIYPVTIDPLVTGPVSLYPPNPMNSCVLPTYASDSMLVTIPGRITITSFIVEDSYFADALTSPPALMEYGHMGLSSVCGGVTFSCQGTAADSSGTCYLVANTDLSGQLSCCFSPSCSDQTFYLVHSLARNNYGPGCNPNYIYYSPYGQYPFSAYIIGRTVETAQSEWSVSPLTICSDICTLSLNVSTKHGVPPYTITHPWAAGSAQYGTATGSCNSIGSHTISLTIPNCPPTCGTNPSISVPPPLVIDVCGDTVKFLNNKPVTVKPVPVATASTVSVCTGHPLTIPVSSCVTGSTFQWTGSNASLGTGNITDNVSNNGLLPITVNYTVTPTANGCTGQPITVSAEIDPKAVITGSLDDTIDPGIAAPLMASGGVTYIWNPSNGLSCSTCPNPLAAPVITTSYFVTGTNEYGCSASDTITVFVTQGGEVLYIPNSFSPDGNTLNDKFCVYGTSIKTIDLQIFDRWGELIFKSNDITKGWDGTFHGEDIEGGVYVYIVNCEYMSGKTAHRKGIVTVLR